MKKQIKSRRKEQISSRLELPEDLIMGDVFVHLIGQREVYIENYRGILVYYDACIRLNIEMGQLEITGKNLLIEDFTEHSMKIRGCISQISFL